MHKHRRSFGAPYPTSVHTFHGGHTAEKTASEWAGKLARRQGILVFSVKSIDLANVGDLNATLHFHCVYLGQSALSLYLIAAAWVY